VVISGILEATWLFKFNLYR